MYYPTDSIYEALIFLRSEYFAGIDISALKYKFLKNASGYYFSQI